MNYKLPITNRSIGINCLHCMIIFSVVYKYILINLLHFTNIIILWILLLLVKSKSWICVCFWQVIHGKTCLENQLKESHKLEIQNDKMSERKGEGLWGISPPYFSSHAPFFSFSLINWTWRNTINVVTYKIYQFLNCSIEYSLSRFIIW